MIQILTGPKNGTISRNKSSAPTYGDLAREQRKTPPTQTTTSDNPDNKCRTSLSRTFEDSALSRAVTLILPTLMSAWCAPIRIEPLVNPPSASNCQSGGSAVPDLHIF